MTADSLLSFPAEPAKTKRVICFGHRNLRESSTLCEWLSVDVVLQCLVRKSLDEAIAQGAGGDAESLDRFSRGDVFHDV